MLEIDQLYFHWKRLKAPALRKINIKFPSGAIHGIIGPNGSGKTTLLKLLAGILSPSSGKLLWNGSNLSNLTRRERSQLISFVPQAPEILFNFKVAEIIAMGSYPLDRRIETSAIEEVLEQVDAVGMEEREINTLSSGEKQRVYIARSLMSRSPVLLLDEPTANLDLKHQLEIWQLLSKLRAQGKLLIIASHDLEAVDDHCDTVSLLDGGRLISSGCCSEVITAGALSETFRLSGEALPRSLQKLNAKPSSSDNFGV